MLIQNTDYTMERKTLQPNNRKRGQNKTAALRVAELFKQAAETFHEDSLLSDRYVFLARKISLKYKTPFTKEQKLHHCKNCGKYLMAGFNSKVRTRQGRVLVHCLGCKTRRVLAISKRR
jgi:ribonuclease P protein subunit RPR2